MDGRIQILKQYINNLENQIQEITMDPDSDVSDEMLQHLCDLQDRYMKERSALISQKNNRAPIDDEAIQWLLAPMNPKSKPKPKKMTCSVGVCKPKVKKIARKTKINDCACKKCNCKTVCRGCPCC